MTEKDYNPEQKQARAMKKQEVANNASMKNVPKETEKKKPEEKLVENKEALQKQTDTEEKVPQKQTEAKKFIKEKPRKDFAVVRIKDVPISTKHSVAICDFIRNKELGDAISDLEKVLKLKKAVPMKGEVPHRRGKGMSSGSGRFPRKASENFIKILRSLAANAVYNGIEEPVVVKAVANIGVRPFGRFGAVRKKRTHLEIEVKDKINKQKEKGNNGREKRRRT